MKEKRQPDQAIARFRKALAIDPKLARAHAAVGNALATRAVHPGWIGIGAAVVLAVAGY